METINMLRYHPVDKSYHLVGVSHRNMAVVTGNQELHVFLAYLIRYVEK